MEIRYVILTVLIAAGCSPLDTKIDTLLTIENLDSDYNKVRDVGYEPYTFMRNGFYNMDSNISAAMSDEAEYTASSSNVQLFNEGSWNQYNNPDNVYEYLYQGIRAANFFLNYSKDYKNQLAHNRDTLNDRGYSYNLDVKDVAWLRAEAHVLRAYYYFELLKRYGGVPLVTDVLSLDDDVDLPRSDYDDIVDYAIGEIDYALDSLQTDWKQEDASRDGRFTKGSALALKSRILLYAASPLHNESNNIDKWKRAAEAAHQVISLNKYSLSDNYRDLFLENNSTDNNEIIMSIRTGAINEIEKANYPIGTPGGNSGITPSQNIVSAYEYIGEPNLLNPYENRDPRLLYTIVTNDSYWNGRTMQIYSGGKDDPQNANASRTGYYLKKFLLDNLYLTQNETRNHSWIIFRYAEILLNYAEAMNEAYGPDFDNGYGMTARDAINSVRSRQGVNMPPVNASGKDEMREKIKHERQIELAFEEHRFYDLLRWKNGEVLNQPLKGIRIQKSGDAFTYSEFIVENRIFVIPKMYLYPIPQTEINKSKGILIQNPGWE